jgi:hypothetical protein
VEDRWHTVSGFGEIKVPKPLTSGFAIPRSPKSRRGDGIVEKSTHERIGVLVHQGSKVGKSSGSTSRVEKSR